MARDWTEILQFIESLIPQAAGGASLDEVLRSNLVPFANAWLSEFDRERRWTAARVNNTIYTTQGTQVYDVAQVQSIDGAGVVTVTGTKAIPVYTKRIYFIDNTGRPRILRKADQYELQRIYGDPVSGGAPNQGEPKYWYSNDLQFIQLYPTPDASGPLPQGRYGIIVESYDPIFRIVETLGNVASTTTLTFAAAGTGSYLTNYGIPTASVAGQNLSVRGAGPVGQPSSLGTNSTLITSWTALAANTLTLGTAASVTVSNLQCFFNSTNWVITHMPKLLQYALLREVSNYFGSDAQYQKWEARYQNLLEATRDWDDERQSSYDLAAVAQIGQKAPSLMRSETMSAIDIRGGS